jgi:6,7-dimethyl-8-ribityllumazine synthase
MKTHEGTLVATEARIAFVVSRFNEFISERLLEGALQTLGQHGGDVENCEVARVPGAFELPIVARALAKTGRFDAVVCLGCVIKGATDHYDYVCGQTASGIMSAGLDTDIPVIFGVLTTDSIEQAIERAGTKAGNKGKDAVLAAIETANVLRSISK